MNRIKLIFRLTCISVALLTACGCGGEKAPPVKPDILLVTIDTLRRDHLGAYGYHRDTSPFIDRLARGGTMYKNVVTPLPLTAASHSSILTSRHPLVHNVLANGAKLHRKVETIAEVLQNSGYYTIGTVAVGLLKGSKNFSQGFDSFSDQWKKEEGLNEKFPLAERTAASVNRSLQQQIDQYLSTPGAPDKPLFIWVHYYDPHGPYYDHKDITFKEKRRSGAPPGVDLYDKEIRYTDRHIETIHQYLQEKRPARQLLTCITADHGEQFGEHGYKYGHMDFYSETTHVPLIFHGPGIPAEKTVETYVSTMDIAATLLDRVGLTFRAPPEGVPLPMDHMDRAGDEKKYLILGDQRYARSLQMFGYPFAFILNFDHHYRHWYAFHGDTEKNTPPFTPLDTAVEKNGNTHHYRLPYSRPRGCNYLVFRLDTPKHNGLAVKIKVKPFLFTDKVKIAPPTGKQPAPPLTVIYPITILDDIRIQVTPKTGTLIKNPRYTIIPAEKLPLYITETTPGKRENRIYKSLYSLRKTGPGDEWFDVSRDIEMTENRLDQRESLPRAINYKQRIYRTFADYLVKRNRLLKGKQDDAALTEEDKKLLKSLGYL